MFETINKCICFAVAKFVYSNLGEYSEKFITLTHVSVLCPVVVVRPVQYVEQSLSQPQLCEGGWRHHLSQWVGRWPRVGRTNSTTSKLMIMFANLGKCCLRDHNLFLVNFDPHRCGSPRLLFLPLSTKSDDNKPMLEHYEAAFISSLKKRLTRMLGPMYTRWSHFTNNAYTIWPQPLVMQLEILELNIMGAIWCVLVVVVVVCFSPLSPTSKRLPRFTTYLISW